MINSGKGLAPDQAPDASNPNMPLHPKSSGFRSNRNSHYETQQLQPDLDAAQKWQASQSTQRGGGPGVSRKHGINSSHDQPQYPPNGVLANQSFNRNQPDVVSAGNAKGGYGSINYNNQPGDTSFFGESSPKGGRASNRFPRNTNKSRDGKNKTPQNIQNPMSSQNALINKQRYYQKDRQQN
jgi:hypothetical protein